MGIFCQEEFEENLPTIDIEQCLRMGVFHQEALDRKLPSSNIEQCSMSEEGSFMSNSY